MVVGVSRFRLLDFGRFNHELGRCGCCSSWFSFGREREKERWEIKMHTRHSIRFEYRECRSKLDFYDPHRIVSVTADAHSFGLQHATWHLDARSDGRMKYNIAYKKAQSQFVCWLRFASRRVDRSIAVTDQSSFSSVLRDERTGGGTVVLVSERPCTTKGFDEKNHEMVCGCQNQY